MEATVVLALVAKTAELLLAIVEERNQKSKRDDLMAEINKLPESPAKAALIARLKEDTPLQLLEFLMDLTNKEFKRRSRLAKDRTELAFRAGILGGIIMLAVIVMGCAGQARYYVDPPVAGVELPQGAPPPEQIYITQIEGRTHVTWIIQDHTK